MPESDDTLSDFLESLEKGEGVGSRVVLILELEDGRAASVAVGFKIGDEIRARAMMSLLVTNGEEVAWCPPGLEAESEEAKQP